jgi:glycosyltransferase involved in cell wall biosynthesis
MRGRAVVIVNGIDLRRTRTDPTVAPRAGDPLLVAIGRLDWEKRFDRLLLAIAEVRASFPDIALVICGGGAQRDALEAQARDLGLNKSVSFTGHVADAAPYLRAADAFISSSVQEGFALSAVESMAMGRPVIATPAAGVGSILRDGETAILAEGFAASDIAAAIVRAFADRGRLLRIADAGRRYAEDNLDVKHAVSAYERIYREVCQANQSRRPYAPV